MMHVSMWGYQLLTRQTHTRIDSSIQNGSWLSYRQGVGELIILLFRIMFSYWFE